MDTCLGRCCCPETPDIAGKGTAHDEVHVMMVGCTTESVVHCILNCGFAETATTFETCSPTTSSRGNRARIE